MKLSKEDWDRLHFEALYWDEDTSNEAREWSNTKQEYKPRHTELRPDNFEGMVVLTIDEAEAIHEAVEWLCSTLEDYKDEQDDTPALVEGWKQMDFLHQKIDQAEKQRQ